MRTLTDAQMMVVASDIYARCQRVLEENSEVPELTVTFTIQLQTSGEKTLGIIQEATISLMHEPAESEKLVIKAAGALGSPGEPTLVVMTPGELQAKMDKAVEAAVRDERKEAYREGQEDMRSRYQNRDHDMGQ